MCLSCLIQRRTKRTIRCYSSHFIPSSVKDISSMTMTNTKNRWIFFQIRSDSIRELMYSASKITKNQKANNMIAMAHPRAVQFFNYGKTHLKFTTLTICWRRVQWLWEHSLHSQRRRPPSEWFHLPKMKLLPHSNIDLNQKGENASV